MLFELPTILLVWFLSLHAKHPQSYLQFIILSNFRGAVHRPCRFVLFGMCFALLLRFRTVGCWFALSPAHVEPRVKRLGRAVLHAVPAADALHVVWRLGRIDTHVADALAGSAVRTGALVELESIE